MAAQRADLAGVVPATPALPEQHEAGVFGALRVRRRDRMPASTVRAVQFVARMQWRIVGGEIAQAHARIFPYSPGQPGSCPRGTTAEPLVRDGDQWPQTLQCC